MNKLLILLLQTCAIILINIDILVPILASKKPTHMDRFLVENHRTRRKENYVLARALSNDIENNDNTGIYTYAKEPLEPNTNPDELPALIDDYANMIRNDIILLDNSVETRTRKRGNIKVQRRNKEALLDGRCTCEQKIRHSETLGENYFPEELETIKCNRTLCAFPYGCQPRYLNITVLKAKTNSHEKSQEYLPSYFSKNWIAMKRAIVVGCFCTREHIDTINNDIFNDY